MAHGSPRHVGPLHYKPTRRYTQSISRPGILSVHHCIILLYPLVSFVAVAVAAATTSYQPSTPLPLTGMAYATANEKTLYVLGGITFASGSVPSASSMTQIFALDLTQASWNTSNPPWTPISGSDARTVTFDFTYSIALSKDQQSLIVWGYHTGVNAFDLPTNSWTSSSSLPSNSNSAVGLRTITDPSTGQIYIPFGANSGLKMMAYNPYTGSAMSLPVPTLPNGGLQFYSAAWSVQRNSILMYGGDSIVGALSISTEQFYEYAPSSGSWGLVNTTGPSPGPLAGHCMVSAYGGTKMILFGGNRTFNSSAQSLPSLTGSIFILDVATMAWTKGQDVDPTQNRTGMTCTVAGDNFVAWGGTQYSGNSASFGVPVIYNLKDNQWTTQFSLPPKKSEGGVIGGTIFGVLALCVIGFFGYRHRRRIEENLGKIRLSKNRENNLRDEVSVDIAPYETIPTPLQAHRYRKRIKEYLGRVRWTKNKEDKRRDEISADFSSNETIPTPLQAHPYRKRIKEYLGKIRLSKNRKNNPSDEVSVDFAPYETIPSPWQAHVSKRTRSPEYIGMPPQAALLSSMDKEYGGLPKTPFASRSSTSDASSTIVPSPAMHSKKSLNSASLIPQHVNPVPYQRNADFFPTSQDARIKVPIEGLTIGSHSDLNYIASTPPPPPPPPISGRHPQYYSGRLDQDRKSYVPPPPSSPRPRPKSSQQEQYPLNTILGAYEGLTSEAVSNPASGANSPGTYLPGAPQAKPTSKPLHDFPPLPRTRPSVRHSQQQQQQQKQRHIHIHDDQLWLPTEQESSHDNNTTTSRSSVIPSSPYIPLAPPIPASALASSSRSPRRHIQDTRSLASEDQMMIEQQLNDLRAEQQEQYELQQQRLEWLRLEQQAEFDRLQQKLRSKKKRGPRRGGEGERE